MSRLETNGYYALGVPLYVALAALELYAARRQRLSPKRAVTPVDHQHSAYGFGDTLGNVSAGLGEVIIGLFIGPLLIALYDFAYARFALFHWPKSTSWNIASWIAAFLLADLCYYIYHRVGHLCAAFWMIHGVHHQSERFNLSLALRHPWFSDFYAPIFYAPLPLLGIPPERFFLAISLISFYALTIHSWMFHRPSLYIFVTPRTHILHHAKNPRYIGKNLGAMFTLWDRMFGTHVEPDASDPPILGTPAGYKTHDGARAQWLFPKTIFFALRHTRSWRSRLRLLFARPGWLPDDVRAQLPPPSENARPDGAIGMAIRGYVAAQFSCTLLLALFILWLRDDHPFSLLCASSALVLWSLSTLGGLLDGRDGAARSEVLRLLATAAFGALLCGLPQLMSYRWLGMTIMAIVGLSIGSLLLIERGARSRTSVT